MHKPLLSICIPTYNRAEYLKVTLESIIRQKRFVETNDVEIVISDNCSADDTQQVVESIAKNFGDKIRYYRNEVNIHDKNMEASLSRGNGEFLKLNNDTLKHTDNSLDEMIRIINSNIEEKNVLFFLNQGQNGERVIRKGLNGFLDVVSFNCTWIGAFGIWKNDFKALDGFNRHAKLQLTQTDVLFRLIGSHRQVCINDTILFESIELAKKGGYDLITVFLDNYNFLLNEALERGDISDTTYKSETRKTLLGFICPWMARLKIYKEKFHFTAKDRFTRIISAYKNRPAILIAFFIKYIAGLVFVFFKSSIKK